MTGPALLDTIQSAAGNDGRQSELVSSLFAIFLTVSVIMFLLVMVFLLWAILRRRRDGASREQGLRKVLVGWVGAIALILAGLTLATWFYDRQLALAAQTKAIEIEINAHQWWWDVHYKHPDPSKELRTANELHLPRGVPVHITLRSGDVIHSFWVPNLAGKQDLIPGRVNDISLNALRDGKYRGQCAEFCGMQHANMALDVTVESPAAFTDWWKNGLKPPSPPATPLAQAGQAIFTSRQCASCHMIAGTSASAQVAPDLTHFASRNSIAAGRLPMDHESLTAWIADPQAVKPGNNMPKVPLSPDELRSVVAYLEGLK